MKKALMVMGLLVFGFTLTSMNLIEKATNIANSVFSWESTMHDFGKVEQSIAVEHKFEFINEGDKPLIISSVKASCGCTVAEYTKEPIAPGESGEVLARYDAKKTGQFHKTVSVKANTGEETVVLTLKGEVVTTE